jgi:ABC-type multidrug transport system fused ATPase/permease subunit
MRIVGFMFESMPRSVVSVRRVDALLDEPDDPAAEGALADASTVAARRRLPEGALSVELDGVSFSYGDEATALTDVSFEIHAGEAIGVVGPSGAGKSTLVQLLLGLRPPTTGHLRVDGVAAAEFTRSSWTRRVSFVPQESALFDRSVLDNVICFRDISRERALDALRAAHVLDEVLGLPDGLDTIVGEGGKRLSGGQRQRVCIARALAGEPDLLILDEPTSALDLASEEAIRQTLDAIMGRMTLIIVAHRMSTLRVCDKVLVINDGRLEAFAERARLEADNEYFSSAVKLAKLV